MRATARLVSTAKTIVIPNWIKNCPDTPGINATGRNTATIDIVVATTARPNSSAAPIEDRKRVGEGKSVAVQVDLGGRRIIKKKKNNIISVGTDVRRETASTRK